MSLLRQLNDIKQSTVPMRIKPVGTACFAYMGEVMLSFKLTGAGDINKEYKAFNTEVYNGMQAGLTAVGSELTKQLQAHVQTDVYDAYTPKDYIRRLNSGGLIDSRYMKTSQRSMSVELTYLPSGYNPRYDGEDYVSGDELINAIENSRYTWEGTDNIPERHFWNNFVDEAVGANGWAEKVLVRAMNSAANGLEVVADGRIERDGGDTLFEQQRSLNEWFDFPDDTDSGGDLPY